MTQPTRPDEVLLMRAVMAGDINPEKTGIKEKRQQFIFKKWKKRGWWNGAVSSGFLTVVGKREIELKLQNLTMDENYNSPVSLDGSSITAQDIQDAVDKLRTQNGSDSTQIGDAFKQDLKDTFVYKAVHSLISPSELPDYMDKWKMEMLIPIYEFLGFSKDEWYSIIKNQECAPYIVQARQSLVFKDKIENKTDIQKFSKYLADYTRSRLQAALAKGIGKKELIDLAIRKAFDDGKISLKPDYVLAEEPPLGNMVGNQRTLFDMSQMVNLKWKDTECSASST